MKYFKYVFIVILSFGLGGGIGYLEALVDHDEYHALHKRLIQNELFSLDNQIAHHKYQILLKENPTQTIAWVEPEVVFCTAEAPQVPKPSSDLETEIEMLQEKERKIWEYTKAHDEVPQDSNKLTTSSPGEWLKKLAGKASEIRKKKQEQKELIAFWSKQPIDLPNGMKIYLSSYQDEMPDPNPLHLAQISGALSLMPDGFEERLKSIYLLYGDVYGPRGSAGQGVVFVDANELNIFPTLIHEFGHLFDLYGETAEGTPSPFHNGITQLPIEDPSVKYYQISWENNRDHFGNTEDFCSCYGSNNPQEDFAEAFAMYVLHGSTFEKWSQNNPYLQKKYAFLKEVFKGRTFSSSKLIHEHPFSVIDLPTDYHQLL